MKETVREQAQRLGVAWPGEPEPKPKPRKKPATNPHPPTRKGEFTTVEAAKAAQVSYRQLDYWDCTGLVSPSIAARRGSGTQRIYSERDVMKLRVIRLLLDAGLSHRQIRAALASGTLEGQIELMVEAQRELVQIKKSDRVAVGT